MLEFPVLKCFFKAFRCCNCANFHKLSSSANSSVMVRHQSAKIDHHCGGKMKPPPQKKLLCLTTVKEKNHTHTHSQSHSQTHTAHSEEGNGCSTLYYKHLAFIKVLILHSPDFTACRKHSSETFLLHIHMTSVPPSCSTTSQGFKIDRNFYSAAHENGQKKSTVPVLAGISFHCSGCRITVCSVESKVQQHFIFKHRVDMDFQAKTLDMHNPCLHTKSFICLSFVSKV